MHITSCTSGETVTYRASQTATFVTTEPLISLSVHSISPAGSTVCYYYRDMKKTSCRRSTCTTYWLWKMIPESSCKVYLLTETECEMYRKKHRHMYLQQVTYTIFVEYSKIHSSMIRLRKQLKETCKQTLKYSASVRPATTDILSVIWNVFLRSL